MTGLCPPQNATVYLPPYTNHLVMAHQCRKLLRENLIDLYLPHSIDLKYGGYFETLEGNVFCDKAPKHLALQSRQLWFFSTLAKRGIDEEIALEAASYGFEFLENHLGDAYHGGFYASASRDGKPIDKRKHVYLETFALLGLVAYHQATDYQPALTSAKTLFETLDNKARDPAYGGVNEWCSEDWTPLPEPTKSPGANGGYRKTLNTHLHILEAYASLYSVWPDNKLRQRLMELITILTSTVLARSANNCIQSFHRDWRATDSEQRLRASYGHDLETVWFVLGAIETLGLSRDNYIDWAKKVSGSCLRFGFDRHNGGFFESGILGKQADKRTKIWWVQAEAMIALLIMFRLTEQAEYYEAFVRTFQFVQQQQIAFEGGWWAKIYEDGSRKKDTARTGKWQGAYHSGRTLMMCGDILEQLAGFAPATAL